MREQARRLVETFGQIALERYLADESLRLISERRIEIIGEAASRVSPQLRSRHPEVPWRDIIGQRNLLIHEYGEIVPERVWQSATLDAPELVRMLDLILAELTGENGDPKPLW